MMSTLVCLLVGHDTGRVWYWCPTTRRCYRDYRYCHRCGRHL